MIRLFLAAMLLATGAASATLVFRDGFEPVAVPDCVDGPLPADVRRGNLAAARGTYLLLGCVEIANDLDFQRTGVAVSGIPLARERALTDSDLDRLALIGAGNRRLAVQVDVLSRWGGPLADTTLPIRWLQVSAAAATTAQGRTRYALVLMDAPASNGDAFAATISPDEDDFVVETGTARFRLDPANPALFESIAVRGDDRAGDFTVVLQDQPGNGPLLAYGPVRIDTSGNGLPVVDDFSIVEAGPVKVVVRLNGHLIDPGGSSLCDATAPPYERFGYTLLATFHRGSRDVSLQYQFRNECSNGDGEPWDDEAVSITEAGWRFPLVLGEATAHYAGAGGIVSEAGVDGIIQVRQRRGGGEPWRRRADVRVGGQVQDMAEAFESPYLAVSDASWLAAIQQPWMRFREPQALSLDGTSLGFDVITESLVLGEGKGLWNFALLTIRPAGELAALERHRRDGLADLERGLLVRPDRELLLGSRAIPPLGEDDRGSAVKTAYRAYLEVLHANTVDKQWAAAKTYGSQLWPDVQFNEQFGSSVNATPAENNPPPNYWNPSGAELLEFLRTGEPRWAWDFALPQSWLQTYTVYLNTFDRRHGRSNGATVNSGGSGEGHWHRNGFGSDDYTYNRGMGLAYALRPSAAMRQRFAHAGEMVIDRYGIPRSPQETRDFFLSRISPERGILQHFENLANCAEFVPGDRGVACHAKLMEVLEELALDNLRAGMICQGDVPDPASCDWPQTFMITSMQYGFFLRMHLNYGHLLPAEIAQPLRRMLVELPQIYYDRGMDPIGQPPTAFSEWAAVQTCTIANDAPGPCERFDTGDGVDIIFQNRPHTLSLGMLAHWLDPSADLCTVSKELLDDQFDGSEPFGPLTGYVSDDGGWYKGAAQVVQQLVYAVGLYDTQCR